MSLRNITVQYVGDTLRIPLLEREVSRIILLDHDMKDWKSFVPDRTCQMSDKNPCPFCGDYSEYSHFINLCAERANEIQRENELKAFTNMRKSLDLVQVVRCKDCKFAVYEGESCMRIDELDNSLGFPVKPDGFCAWGELDDARDIQ